MYHCINSELRGFRAASNDSTLRMAKRKIQNVIMKIWDTIDAQSVTVMTVPSGHSSDSSHWTVFTEHGQVMVDCQEENENDSPSSSTSATYKYLPPEIVEPYLTSIVVW